MAAYDSDASRIRVMCVIARLNVGGPAIHVVELSAGLDAGRFETLLVAGRHGQHEGDMSDLASAAAVNLHVIPELGRDIRPWADVLAQFKLYALMRRVHPDIVHTHTFKAGALGRTAARLAGVPIVVHTFHGHTFRGYWGPARTWVAVLLERWLARWSTAILTVSERVRRELIEFRIAPPERIHVLPLGLRLDPFMHCQSWRGEFRAELGIGPDVPLVGIVGRMVPIKNHALFLEVARRLVDSGFGGRFVVVGDGELSDQVQGQAAVLGLSDRVYFTGWRRDLERIYADLNVLVNTARNEGTPVAVIEAMAARVPVVATAVGGVPDLILPGETGYLAPVDDPEAIARAVQQALRSPQAMLAAAQKSALERHSLSLMLSRAGDIYSALLGAEARVGTT